MHIYDVVRRAGKVKRQSVQSSLEMSLKFHKNTAMLNLFSLCLNSNLILAFFTVGKCDILNLLANIFTSYQQHFIQNY